MNREISFSDQDFNHNECLVDCTHMLAGYPGVILMANDDDPYYVEKFTSREDAEKFVLQFQRLMDKAWPPELMSLLATPD